MRSPAVAALLSTVLLAPPALAEPASPDGGVDLVWNAPAGCPSRDAVLAEVRRALTGSRPRPAAARADVTILTAVRWSVHLVTNVNGAQGERAFEADSCAALASAAALIVAWTIDPLRARAPAAGAPTKVTSKESTAATSRPARSRSGFSGLVAIAAQGDLGTLPSAAPAAEATAGATFGHLRAEVSGSAWAGQDVKGSATEGTHLHLFDGTLRGCWRGLIGQSVEIDPCLGAGIVHASSEGFGESTPYRSDGWWWMARGDLLTTWALVGPVSLRVMVGVVVPLARPSIVILSSQNGEVPLHQSSSTLALRGSLGLEVNFP